MAKKSVRSLPYRVYKKFFAGCKAYDYDNGKITVELPAAYLNDKIVVPDGWREGDNWVSSPAVDGKQIQIQWHSDVVRYYDVYVTMDYHNAMFPQMSGPKRKSNTEVIGFNEALQWALAQ